MTGHYTAHMYASNHNTPSTSLTGSSIYNRSSDVIVLRICEGRNVQNLQNLITQRNQTIKQLKEAIAQRLGAYQSLDELILEEYDSLLYRWKIIADTYSTRLIDSYQLEENTILSLRHEIRPLSIDNYSSYPLSTSTRITQLPLKVCEEPMDTSAYSFISVYTSSTIGDLRKNVYEACGKLPKDHPIFVRIEDHWMKFDATNDKDRIADMLIKEYTFVSTDYDENISDVKCLPGLCGLTNFGSTCFMNSVFQCLSNIPKFTDQILCLSDEINAPIIGEYKKLMQKIWSGKKRDIEPRELVDNIQTQLPRYTTYRQQDAQEFLHHFLHLIHDEFSTRQTIITQLFYGQLRSSVKCLQCQQIETTTESISSLPLPISNHDQKFVRYIKTDGEQRFVSIQIDSSIRYMDDLVKCFINQHDTTLTLDKIVPVQLVNERAAKEYGKYDLLRYLEDGELAFMERPSIAYQEKYIYCHFVDITSQKQFRPSVFLVRPDYDCRYTHLEDQIEQLVAHFCSLTGAHLSDISIYWEDLSGNERQIRPETDANEILSCIKAIKIKMTTEFVDIYKQQYNFNRLKDKSSLLGLIDDFFNEEQLDGSYECSKCSKSTKAVKKSQLCLPLPRVLLIHLKRFTFNQYSNDKIDTLIPYPLTDLDLSEYIFKRDSSQLSSTKYDLVAVSNHTGTLNCGHYTTYAKNQDDKQWYSFDDRYVRKIENEQEVITKNAYILVYIQKDS